MTETTPIYTAAAPGHEYAALDHRWHHHKKRFSWQPIVAGIAAALAVQVVLGLLGIGLGFGMMAAPNALPWHETPTIGALMWAGVSILTSAFYGGFIAARLSKNSCHHEGALSGIVSWAGSVLVVLFLLTNSYGSLFGGASQIMGHFAGPHFGYERFAAIHPPMPNAPATPEALNHPELTVAPLVQDEAAKEKAALAAGVVLLLAAFVSAIGGILGAAHVKHHRQHYQAEA